MIEARAGTHADILGLGSRSLFSLRRSVLRRLSQLVEPFGGEVHAVVPLQRPVGEGELHELVVVEQLFTELARQQRLEVDDATLAVAELQLHRVVVQVVHIDHSQ